MLAGDTNPDKHTLTNRPTDMKKSTLFAATGIALSGVALSAYALKDKAVAAWTEQAVQQKLNEQFPESWESSSGDRQITIENVVGSVAAEGGTAVGTVMHKITVKKDNAVDVFNIKTRHEVEGTTKRYSVVSTLEAATELQPWIDMHEESPVRMTTQYEDGKFAGSLRALDFSSKNAKVTKEQGRIEFSGLTAKFSGEDDKVKDLQLTMPLFMIREIAETFLVRDVALSSSGGEKMSATVGEVRMDEGGYDSLKIEGLQMLVEASVDAGYSSGDLQVIATALSGRTKDGPWALPTSPEMSMQFINIPDSLQELGQDAALDDVIAAVGRPASLLTKLKFPLDEGDVQGKIQVTLSPLAGKTSAWLSQNWSKVIAGEIRLSGPSGALDAAMTQQASLFVMMGLVVFEGDRVVAGGKLEDGVLTTPGGQAIPLDALMAVTSGQQGQPQ